MSNRIKNQREILAKLGIEALNPMQEAAQHAIHATAETVVLSPTGTGKTLAFLLPLVAGLSETETEVQALIITPTRELTIQIEQVLREMGTGYKISAAYGGRSFSSDKLDLKHPPAVVIGTPGRVAAHLRRRTFTAWSVQMLVLDEFDKSLEVGFEEEMSEIVRLLPSLRKKVLTSATKSVVIPEFLGLKNPQIVDFLGENQPQLTVKKILSPEKDKLNTLLETLCHLGEQRGIIFCNFKDAIQRVSDFLTAAGVAHGCFFGGMEQHDRERALIKFRNGTHRILLATDLAARGIDVSELDFILHYHLPLTAEAFTHRNGRTARMHAQGTAYLLQGKGEPLPDFVPQLEVETLQASPLPAPSIWQTVFVSGGRQDKISKGDVAGFFFRQADLKPEDLGVIELKKDCAFVGVNVKRIPHVLKTLDGSRLKTKKVQVRVI